MGNAVYMTQTTVEAMAAEVGDLLTVAEAARIVRVSPVTIYEAVSEGRIKDVIRVGRRGIRIPAQSFRDYVQSLRTTSPSAEGAAFEMHPDLTPTASPALPEPVSLGSQAA